MGLIKTLASRCLNASGLPEELWTYSVRYAAQSLICSALQRKQRSPPFGSTVIAMVLDHKGIKFTQPKSITGRLLFWDHLQDQVSYLLCPDEDATEEPTVYRAGTPALSPPDPPQPKAAFDKELKGNDLSQPLDLEEDLAENGGLEDSPFTFLYLSSHDSTQAMHVKEQEGEDDNDNDELMKQAAPSPQPLQEEGEEERISWRFGIRSPGFRKIDEEAKS